MMGINGFRTKKELKAAIGKRPDFIETSLFGAEYKGDGSYTVVGPDPYQRRSWFALITVKNDLIAGVK